MARLYILAKETNIDELNRIINSTSTISRPLPGFECLSIGFDRLAVGVDCDKIYENLLIGDKEAAMSKLYLHHLGVTHVINAAEGNFRGMVDTSAQYYADCPVVYMGFPIIDEPWYNIYNHFGAAAVLIDHGINCGGRVLVHCFKGRSRSATLVAAYLMIKKSMPAPLAIETCCRMRGIKPNIGFLHQLVLLDNHLRHNLLPPVL